MGKKEINTALVNLPVNESDSKPLLNFISSSEMLNLAQQVESEMLRQIIPYVDGRKCRSGL